MNSPAPMFTVSQIGNAIPRSRFSVRRLLADVQPSGKIIANNNEANAWHFDALSETLRAEIAVEAQRRGYRDALALLASAPSIWECPRPLKSIPQDFVSRAYQWRDALALPLQKQHELSRRELTALGASEFQKVFGYALSEKQWNRIFERTVQRDGGAQNYSRLEIYLDDAAFKSSAPKTEVIAALPLHREMDEILAHLDNKQAPTMEDREWIFSSAILHYEKLIGENADKQRRGQIKNSLAHYIFQAVPALAKTEPSLRRVFEIHLQKHRSGSATADQRRLKSGNSRTSDFAEDKGKILEKAILLGGNESLAHRMLRQNGELSDEFVSHYHFDPRRNKSYVPQSVRAEITPSVEMCGPIHRGPWEAKMRGPYIPRDWSGVAPGDFFSGDDVTWNNYFYFYDDDGQVHIERGECLLITDLRTGYVLDFLLIAGKYNGRHIRSVLSKVHDACATLFKSISPRAWNAP